MDASHASAESEVTQENDKRRQFKQQSVSSMISQPISIKCDGHLVLQIYPKLRENW